VESNSGVSDVGNVCGYCGPGPGVVTPKIDACCGKEDSAQMAARVSIVFVKRAKADTGSEEGGIVTH